jgi:hypothetical protein
MYEPHADRKAWARQQLSAARVPEPTRTAILSVYDTWLNMMPDDVDEQQQALRIISQLVTGQSIEYHASDETPENWQPVRLGNIRRGDYVRVMSNAYTGDAGMCHNGRKGPVLRVTNGDVVIRYDDGLEPDPGILGSHHSPYKLEKRVP